jgi:glycosyltransferase involved in cell wall biosynthesis
MNLQYPLVSFIIAAYNEEKYIIECIKSCLNQTYKNIEICITDDGSIDNTWKILISRYQSNTKVKLGRFTKNRGKVAAFNNSFRISKGKYIAIMGADDICLSDRIKYSLENIADYELIFGNIIRFSSKNINANNLLKNNFSLIGNQEISFNQLIEKPIVYGQTIFMKRALSNYLFPLDEELNHEDWWIPLYASYRKNIRFIDKIFCKYRIHSGQQTVNFDFENDDFYGKWRKKRYREIVYYRKIKEEFKLSLEQEKLTNQRLYECFIFKTDNFLNRINYYLKWMGFSRKISLTQILIKFVIVIHPKLYFYLINRKYFLQKSIKNYLINFRG